jgi:hypothetical protein
MSTVLMLLQQLPQRKHASLRRWPRHHGLPIVTQTCAVFTERAIGVHHRPSSVGRRTDPLRSSLARISHYFLQLQGRLILEGGHARKQVEIRNPLGASAPHFCPSRPLKE